MSEQIQKCAFCGKHKDEVKHLIEGEDNAFICNEMRERMRGDANGST